MIMTGYVLFWYPLGVKLTWGHAHKTRTWYLLGVTLKKCNKHPRHFYIGVPLGHARVIPHPPPPRYTSMCRYMKIADNCTSIEDFQNMVSYLWPVGWSICTLFLVPLRGFCIDKLTPPWGICNFLKTK